MTDLRESRSDETRKGELNRSPRSLIISSSHTDTHMRGWKSEPHGGH